MQSVIITGASSGIGAETARLFSDKGFFNILLGRNEQRLKETADSLSGPSKIFPLDISQPESISEFTSWFLENQQQETPLSCLINNAGIVRWNPFEDSTDQEWTEQMQTNLLGPVQLTRGLFKAFRENPTNIINMASTCALRHVPNSSAYSASKAAMVMWTKNLAAEWANYNIRVNSISPAMVNTPIHNFKGNITGEVEQLIKDIHPLGRMGEPHEVASACFHIASQEWMTGTNMVLDGGACL